MRNLLRDKTHVGFGLALLILALISAVSVLSATRFVAAGGWVAHTMEINRALSDLLAQVSEAESAGRGYAITGQDRYLAPFREAVPAARRELAGLRGLVADNFAQSRRLGALVPLIARRMVLLDALIRARRDRGEDAARRLVQTDEGRRTMAAIRARLAEMARAEERLLGEQSSAASALARTTIMVVLIGSVLAVACVLLAIYLIDRDTARRRRAEDALARVSRQHAALLNAVGEGIWGLDLDGRATFVNPAAACMLGYEPAELAGQAMHALTHHTTAAGEPYSAEVCPIHAAFRQGATARVAGEVFWRKDGTSFPVEYTATPVMAGERITGAVVTFKDITERREVERMKDEFVSVVSHELRTPLASIRGSLGLLAGGLAVELPDQARRMLDIALANTNRLVRLINDILDIERMESGQAALTLADCDAAALMAQAADTVRPVAERAGVALAVEPLAAALRADPDRVVQVLTNLLGNAVKFSPAGGTVRLAAALAGGEVAFVVEDEGRGIPADKLETIFGRFQQVDSSDARAKGGTGLGLAICRSIVAQHGGRIWAGNRPGGGAVLTFTLADPGAVAAAAPVVYAVKAAEGGKERA